MQQQQKIGERDLTIKTTAVHVISFIFRTLHYELFKAVLTYIVVLEFTIIVSEAICTCSGRVVLYI